MRGRRASRPGLLARPGSVRFARLALVRRSLVFVGPRRVAVRGEEIALPPPPGHLLIKTLRSAVSAGTELLAYRGELPADLPLDETLPGLAGGSFAYPFRYGYAAVGAVIATGAGVERRRLGTRVFAFQSHASDFVCRAEDAFELPPRLGADAAALYPHAETAVNLVLDGAPLVGERVAVIGQGLVGLATTALLARFPLAELAALEPVAARGRLARALGARVCASAEALRAQVGSRGADLVYELSGDPAALDTALAVVGREGRVVVGSWYGQRRAPIDLGGHFHRGRLRLLSSQVSHIAPHLQGRWDRARRREEAWRLLAALPAARLITHKFPIERAREAYELLDRGDRGALGVLFVYD